MFQVSENSTQTGLHGTPSQHPQNKEFVGLSNWKYRGRACFTNCWVWGFKQYSPALWALLSSYVILVLTLFMDRWLSAASASYSSRFQSSEKEMTLPPNSPRKILIVSLLLWPDIKRLWPNHRAKVRRAQPARLNHMLPLLNGRLKVEEGLATRGKLGFWGLQIRRIKLMLGKNNRLSPMPHISYMKQLIILPLSTEDNKAQSLSGLPGTAHL